MASLDLVDLWRAVLDKRYVHETSSELWESGPTRRETIELYVFEGEVDSSRPWTQVSDLSSEDSTDVRALLNERVVGKDGGLKTAIINAIKATAPLAITVRRYVRDEQRNLSFLRPDPERTYENTNSSEEIWSYPIQPTRFNVSVRRTVLEHD